MDLTPFPYGFSSGRRHVESLPFVSMVAPPAYTVTRVGRRWSSAVPPAEKKSPVPLIFRMPPSKFSHAHVFGAMSLELAQFQT